MNQTYALRSDWLFLDRVPENWRPSSCYEAAKNGACIPDAAALLSVNSWRTVHIPHDYAVERNFSEEYYAPLGFKRPGKATYLRFFDVPELLEGERVILEFQGVAGTVDLYCNRTHLLHHRSSYTGFFVDITDVMMEGEQNMLCLLVDGDTFEGWWYEGAGIYRPVLLHVKSRVHFAPNGCFLAPVSEKDGWYVQAQVEVANTQDTAAKLQVHYELLDHNVILSETVWNTELSAYTTETFSFKNIRPISAPRLWSPEHPELYRSRISLIVDGAVCDVYETSTGFRTLELRGRDGLFCNGAPYFFKGICCHQDHAGVGIALTEDLMRYRIGILKEMGCNAYRSAHGCASPLLMQVCDEMGMFILNENRHFDTSDMSMEELQSMVRYSRNHPSVFAYSLFNEEPMQTESVGRKTVARMQREVLALDSTRWITGAIHVGLTDDGNVGEQFSLAGANYQLHLFDAFSEKYPEKNLLATENACIFATRGIYRNDESKHHFQSYGTERASWGMTIEETWQTIRKYPFIISAFMWCGFDYRGEPAPYFAFPSVSTHWGITDSCGFRKDTFYILQACYSDFPVVHIIPDFPQAEDGSYTMTVISNCETVMACVEDAVFSGRKIDYNRFEISLPAKYATMTVRGFLGEKETEDTYTAPQRETARLTLSHRGNIIFAEMKDASGVDVSDDAKVSFTVQGGEILGVGNGDPASLEADHADSRHLFSGKCQMILHPSASEVTVTAETEHGMRASLTYLPASEEAFPALPSNIRITVKGMRKYLQAYEGELSDFRHDARDMNNYALISGQKDIATDGRHILIWNTTAPKGRNAELVFRDVRGGFFVRHNGMIREYQEDCTIALLPGENELILDVAVQDGVGGFALPLCMRFV